MARMPFSAVTELLRTLGQPVSTLNMPKGLFVGPFTWDVDLGTALVATTDVTALNDVANINDPQLEQAGFTANNPDLGLMIWGAELVLSGTAVDTMDQDDMAALNALLYLRVTDGKATDYYPLKGGVYRQTNYSQHLQAMAANAAYYADHQPRIAVFSRPLYIPTLKSIDTFSLYSHAAHTFVNGSDPAQSYLHLHGAVFKTASYDAPAPNDCAEMDVPTAQQLSSSRLFVNRNLG